MVSVIASLKNKHQGECIAILGSGPSLLNYRGDAEVSIAVNGAAAIDHSYSYFVCGDKLSPARPWFQLSRKCGAIRIVSNVLAIHDPLLYPDEGIRKNLQQDFQDHKRRYSLFGKPAKYAFLPRIPPTFPHLYFKWGGSINRLSLLRLKWWLTGSSPRFLAGASISGVALQMAVYMGARQVDLYGVDLSNFDGQTYFNPVGNEGQTKAHHIDNFAKLSKFVQKQGVEVRHSGDAQ